jgi:hypothetical protein
MSNPWFFDPRGKADSGKRDSGKANRATGAPATDTRGLLKQLGLAPDAKSVPSVQREVPQMFGPSGAQRVWRSDELPPGMRYAAEQEAYARLLRSGAEKLVNIAFGRPEFGRDAAAGGDPVFGVENFDERFWTRAPDPRWRYRLVLLPKKHAADAIDAIFAKQSVWMCDCALFVQILHLYALRHTYGAAVFNERQGAGMLLRVHGSTGVDRRVLYERGKPNESMQRSDGRVDERSPEQILQAVPLGTRVMWTNLKINPDTPAGRRLDAYRQENTVKVGADRYAALGFGAQRIFSRADLEGKLARLTDPAADHNYIQANVFVKEVEEFHLPFDKPDPAAPR